MELSLPQKLWLNRAPADAILEKLRQQTFSVEDLRAYASVQPQFAAKLAYVENLLNNMPDPAENADFESAVAASDKAPFAEETGRLLEAYLAKWGSLPSATPHVTEVQGAMSRFNEYKQYERLRSRVESAIMDYDTRQIPPAGELIGALGSFVTAWKEVAFASQHVAECQEMKERLSGMVAGNAERAWKAILDSDGRLASIEAAKEFLARYGDIGDYRTTVDNKIWEWALGQADVEAGVRVYDDFYRGIGRHSHKVNSVRRASAEWSSVDGSDIYSVLEFIGRNPEHIFAAQAARVVEKLKGVELERLRRSPLKYDNLTFCTLYDKKVCTKEELCEASGADEETFQRILDDERIRKDLPPSPNENSRYASGVGEKGLTDVVFFGIASSGKTCVLSGLLSHDDIDIDEANWSGEYASLLKKYGKAGIAISGTPENFVAMIKATARRPEGVKHHFNLVEMAGETFVNKIVNAMGRDGKLVTSFADMGTQAPEILNNGNRKLFFILIDPTSEGREQALQAEAVNRLKSLMFGKVDGRNPNEAIMRRVEGLHFIVTKADTLAGGPSQAREVVHGILNRGARESLVESCREYGINASDESELDGRPRIFPFSLGRFNVGNIYTYNPADSDVLLNVICDYTAYERKGSFLRKLRQFMTTPIF